MLTKPKVGSPCNSCGYCCRMSLCPLARNIFGPLQDAPCPALEQDGEKQVCGLIHNPHNYVGSNIFPVTDNMTSALSDAAKHLVGVGAGCDSVGPNDTDLIHLLELRKKWISELTDDTRNMTRVARKIWGV